MYYVIVNKTVGPFKTGGRNAPGLLKRVSGFSVELGYDIYTLPDVYTWVFSYSHVI